MRQTGAWLSGPANLLCHPEAAAADGGVLEMRMRLKDAIGASCGLAGAGSDPSLGLARGALPAGRDPFRMTVAGRGQFGHRKGRV